jgi:hypothetical protein
VLLVAEQDADGNEDGLLSFSDFLTRLGASEYEMVF